MKRHADVPAVSPSAKQATHQVQLQPAFQQQPHKRRPSDSAQDECGSKRLKRAAAGKENTGQDDVRDTPEAASPPSCPTNDWRDMMQDDAAATSAPCPACDTGVPDEQPGTSSGAGCGSSRLVHGGGSSGSLRSEPVYGAASHQRSTTLTAHQHDAPLQQRQQQQQRGGASTSEEDYGDRAARGDGQLPRLQQHGFLHLEMLRCIAARTAHESYLTDAMEC